MQRNSKEAEKSKRKEEDTKRGFARLMLQGKTKQALKLINHDDKITGVHSINQHVRTVLQDKHPEAEPCHPEVIVTRAEQDTVENVIFEEIDRELVKRAAKRTSGSGGPTQIDADVWQHILCSKYYGTLSDSLADEIANFAKKLCTTSVDHEKIDAFVACR